MVVSISLEKLKIEEQVDRSGNAAQGEEHENMLCLT